MSQNGDNSATSSPVATPSKTNRSPTTSTDSQRRRTGSQISGMTLRKSLTKVKDGDVWGTYRKGRKLG